MGKNILMIAHFCSDFDGKGNNRFNYLADFFAANGFHVELITSDFSHSKKQKRERFTNKDIRYNVTFIEEPVYKRNVSIKRVYSHYIMGKNLKKYLDAREIPDVIYCAVPSLDAALVAAKFARSNNIRFIIDIQDLWPEAFKLVFNIPILSDLVFYPMVKTADYIYKSADEIIAVSQTYANRALKNNSKSKNAYSIYLGTDLCKFDCYAKINRLSVKPNDEIWLAYVGTLGHSYDLYSVIDALRILKNKGIKNIRFIVMGDGPLKSNFEEYAKKQEIDVEFTGRLSYEKMVGILTVCDIAVNPISKGAAQSIINKHADYAAAGLPVINTQESSEYRNLIDTYKAGFNCINGDAADVADKLLLFMDNSTLRREMGLNNRRLAEEKFDRKKTYKKIIELLMQT